MSGADAHLGIDIGTQGARAVAVTADGEVIARSSHPLAVPAADAPQEQEPRAWWDALVEVVRALGPARARIATLALSCTSGSVCGVDADGDAVGPGLLYADRRAITSPGNDASWAVAKIAWMVEHRPDVVAGTACFTSPGGYLASQLLGGPAPIDVTQALKFGFDPARDRWGEVPVPVELLPPVVTTGAPLGPLGADAVRATGLPAATIVVAGATDGVAGQLACRPAADRWAVAIGSTIVWKAMAPARIDAPDHGIYSHRGPDGWWFPGAASSAGARILSTWATDDDLERLDGHVAIGPHVDATYPSVVQGERFPFADPGFEPWLAAATSGEERYASEALGIAFVERWGCQELVVQGCPTPSAIATTGGLVASTTLTQLRADVMQVPIEVPLEASSAFGAAVIAAASTAGGLLGAGASMVRFARHVEPDTSAAGRWDDSYARFRARCIRGEHRS